MKNLFLHILFLGLVTTSFLSAKNDFEQIPTSHKGRFRPIDTYSKQWLYDLYHHNSIKKEHLTQFHLQSSNALNFVWQLHFFGHSPWDNSPLFWIHKAELKKLLALDPNEDRFSYHTLRSSIFENESANLSIMRKILTAQFQINFLNRPERTTIELTNLAPGLWLSLQNDKLFIVESPIVAPWHFLKPGMILNESISNLKIDKTLLEDFQNLLAELTLFENISGAKINPEKDLQNSFVEMMNQGFSPKEIALKLEQLHPLRSRLQQSGVLLKMLPSKNFPGEWYSLHALHANIYNPTTQQFELIGNFTAYSDDLFEKIRNEYFALEKHSTDKNFDLSMANTLFELLQKGYSQIEGKPYKKANEKKLTYPTSKQLWAESFYSNSPFLILCIVFYLIALLAFLFGITLHREILCKLGAITMLGAFLFHSLILALRVYILARPPVSNMFETILYVPWVAVLSALLLRIKYKNLSIMISATIASLALLILLFVTNLDSSLENVQAVLDSQYWLIIHVLMVVGSYGVFLLCGILGHIYLAGRAMYKVETENLSFIANFILQTMYVGIALLVCGTILGGVWAAESWGRFWDWDPKESWAFISICVYLAWVHAYRFNKIGHIGLAFGAVTGFLAISFTWYGVNYILGTGMHSYGFGNGGEWFYYSYLMAEVAFLGVARWLLTGQGSQKSESRIQKI